MFGNSHLEPSSSDVKWSSLLQVFSKKLIISQILSFSLKNPPFYLKHTMQEKMVAFVSRKILLLRKMKDYKEKYLKIYFFTFAVVNILQYVL